jgi:type IX secretion system PorP/SprF family membrane protein
MKIKITTITLMLTGLVAFAQQDAQFSMNMFNRLAVNPAYAGMNKALCGTMFYRQQWTAFPGAPKTGLLSVDFGEVAFGGVGLTVSQDQLGFDRTLQAKLAYSFHLPLGPGSLGIGIDAGMIQKSLQGNFIDPSGNTSALPGNDPSIPWSGTSAVTYDVGLGLYYSTQRMYVGISSLHLPQQDLTATSFNYKVARHYYIMAGYTFQLGNRMVFGGFSYRLSDAVVGIIGLEKSFTPKLAAKFGYSYDMTTSAIKSHSNGSHEIMLGFCYKIKSESKSTSHMNVRFL